MSAQLLDRRKKRKLSLLVVEPNHNRRGEISAMLKDLDVEADTVSDEHHASELLEKKDYHAIVASGGLPGFHFLQLMAARFTMTRRSAMPVVAAVMEKDREFESRWGEDNDFDEKLEWPINPSVFRQFVNDCHLHHQAL